MDHIDIHLGDLTYDGIRNIHINISNLRRIEELCLSEVSSRFYKEVSFLPTWKTMRRLALSGLIVNGDLIEDLSAMGRMALETCVLGCARG